MIWRVVVYEIAEQPDSKMMFSRVFEYVTYGLALFLLGISLFAKPILEIMVTAEYLPAAEFIPIICLAYLLFSLHEHFRVPVMLAKRTVTLLPVSVLAVCINISFNLLLIPRFGTIAAVWVSVLTFSVFSFVGLYRYRKIDVIEYPFKRFGLVLSSMIVTFVAYWFLVEGEQTSWNTMGLGALLWVFWLVGLFGGPVRALLKHYNWEDIKKFFLKNNPESSQLVDGGKA